MKNKLLAFLITSITLSAQAGQFKQLSMHCKSTSQSVISELQLSVQNSASSDQTSYLSTLATVNGSYCNIDSAKLTQQELATVKSQLFTKELTLNCYSSKLSNNAIKVILNIDSAKESANLIYSTSESTVDVVNMSCTSEGLFKRIKDSLKFPEIGS